MKKILFLLSIIACTYSQAQDRVLYGNPYVSQSLRSNPGFMPKYKFHLGLPAISNVKLALASPSYTLSDILIGNGLNNPTQLNVDGIMSSTKPVNYIGFEQTLDFLSFGFRVKELNQVSLNISLVNDLTFGFSDGFVNLLMNGNAGEGMLGQTHTIDRTGINTTSYLDFGIALTREAIEDKLWLGIRPRFLVGLTNASTTNTELTINTDPNTFEISGTSAVDVRLGGLGNPIDNELTGEYIADNITSFSNNGFAFDIGGSYQFNEDLLLSANIADIGFINWNNGVQVTRDNSALFTFTPDTVLLSDDENALRQHIYGMFGLPDSAQTDEIFETAENEGYTSTLPTRLNIGANYTYNDYLSFTGLAQGRIMRGRFSPSLSVGANVKLNDILYFSANYSAIDGSYNNIGAALTVNGGPIQMFIASDNLIGLTRLDYTNYINAQFGINIITGYSEKKAEKKAKKKATKSQKKTKSDNKESTKTKDDAKSKK